MAKTFGQYTGGIEASTGNLVAASSKMAEQTTNAIAGIGQNIAQGIKAYNDNAEKSEMANEKIKMLGQQYAEKIAMYSKDPEIAQSGILDGLISTHQMLIDAPTKGFAQRAQIAMGAEAKLSGFGGQLQEMMFLRGREMERVSEEGLRRLAGETSVTSPRFSKAEEFKADPNLSLEENKAKALGYLNKVRALNPKLQGTDQDFLANWLSTAEQDIAKADPTKVHPTVISSMLEQIQADKRIQKNNADANKTGVVEDFLSKGKMSSRADYDKTMTPAAEALTKQTDSAKNFAPAWLIEKAKEEKRLTTDIQAQLQSAGSMITKQVLDSVLGKVEAGETVTPDDIRKLVVQSELENNSLAKGNIVLPTFTMPPSSMAAGYLRMAKMPQTDPIFSPAAKTIMDAIGKDKLKSNRPLSANDVLGIAKKVSPNIDEFKKASANLIEQSKNVKLADEQKVPSISMGEVVLGSMEETKKRTVAERQREVADFVTSRMGAIDPTDPERKRRLPVVGFDKFYKSLVPEAEIREFTTDGGIRMVHANGKWEQVKSADKMTPAEIRKGNIGVFGKQTADGRLVPSEFIPDSGVFIGGLFSGSDSAVDKFQEELPKLIDARRGVKVLREINDQMGESLSPTAQGIALVEEMNLSAMLRTDIVGVGTVSNYEQQLIKRVTENSVNFFSLESKDRAILIALAERVDRRIKNLSAAHGLTVRIEDDRGVSKYQALREQYLKEKGLL